jgi:hypothetical protein
MGALLEFLSQSVTALAIILTMIASYAFYVFKIKRKSFKEWRENEGLGSAASAGLGVGGIILIAFIIFVVSAIFSQAKSESLTNGTWFNSTSIFIGIDVTRGVSPQCVEGGADNKGTSNMGIRQNLFMSQNKVFAINGKYTHHSCVIGKDRNGYDGLGLEFEWFIF